MYLIPHIGRMALGMPNVITTAIKYRYTTFLAMFCLLRSITAHVAVRPSVLDTVKRNYATKYKG